MELFGDIKHWMDSIELPMTIRSKQFLVRFQVLLILRGYENHVDPRSVQSAMEVILNLRRFPVRQNS